MKLVFLFFLNFFFLTFAYSQTQWQRVADLPGPGRHHPVTFSIENYGYLVTGVTDTSVLKDFYRYDPSDDSWLKLEDYPGPPRGFAYGVTYNGKAYMGFGYDGVKELGDLWEFDPATGEWTELQTCPCKPRFHPAFVQVNGKIYMGLGNDFNGDLRDWWEYDIATDTWTEKETFPSTERHHPYYFSIGDSVYVGFGHHTQFIYNDFYKYIPATDTWTRMADFPGSGRVAGTQFSYDGKGYILSGDGETHVQLEEGEFWEYDALNDNWIQLESHPGSGRWAPGSFVIEDDLYFTCGQSTTRNEADVWKYDLAGEVTSVLGVGAQYSPLKVYPNPARKSVWVELPDGVQNIKRTYLVNSWSQVSVVSQIGSSLSLDGFPSGVYSLFVETVDGQTFYSRVVVMD